MVGPYLANNYLQMKITIVVIIKLILYHSTEVFFYYYYYFNLVFSWMIAPNVSLYERPEGWRRVLCYMPLRGDFHGDFKGGLRFQPSFRNKSWNEIDDYMERVSVWAESSSWTEKVHVTKMEFQPRLRWCWEYTVILFSMKQGVNYIFGVWDYFQLRLKFAM